MGSHRELIWIINIDRQSKAEKSCDADQMTPNIECLIMKLKHCFEYAPKTFLVDSV